MRMIVTGLAAVLLAGCGAYVDIDNLGGPAAGSGAGQPTGNAAAPGQQRPQGGPMAPRTGRATREGTIAACVEDLSRSLPRGTDFQALCTCSVDRMIAGTPQMDAVRQCAREQNVTLPGQ
jgi:hypothetical protein